MNALFWIATGFLFVAPTVVGITTRSAAIASVTVACGAFVMLAARLDRMTELSLGPVNAKMKETIAEANATINQLREVTTTMATATLTNMMATNFMGGMSLRKRLELHDQLIQQLQNLGVSDDQQRSAQTEWRKGMSILYFNVVLRAAINGRAPEDTNMISSEYHSLLDFPNWQAPTSGMLTRFCEQRNLLNAEVRQWIDDYQQFLNTGEIRRQGEFLSAADPRT
jgi:hypothetical protein